LSLSEFEKQVYY
jgi:hypothetical protein